MALNFDQSFTRTEASEGYLVWENVPGDTGGETFSGISRVNNPKWEGWAIIDGYKNDPNFPKVLKTDPQLPGMVKSFYKANYADVVGYDDLQAQVIADEIFDLAVNCGTGTAGSYLQRALNCSYPPNQYFPPLTVDGNVGSNTIKALTAVLQHEPAQQFVNALNAFAAKHYVELAENKGDQKFFRGWLQRVSIIPV